MLNKNIKVEDEESIKEMLENINISMENHNGKLKVFLNDEDVTEKIRTPEVTKMSSEVSKLKIVRAKLANLQRKMAQGKNVIMEGRDICTVVFPTADVKIFLDAELEERAKRRYKQNQEKNINMSYEEVLKCIEERDTCDREREIGALKVADGATVIDSTNMSIKEVENTISKIIDLKMKEKKNEAKIYKIRKETTWKKIVRAVIKFLIHLFYEIVFRLEKVNEKNVPTDEPIIVCANHLNTWDAVAIVCCSKRRIRFIAKEDLFNNGFLNWIAHVFDVIPIKRGMRDMEAMKRCIKALKDGEAIGLFPEGTRKGLEKGAKVQNGAAYMALKTNVRVVPIGIQGSFKPFTKVKLYYGEPLDLNKYNSENPEKDKLDLATKEIMDNIIMLTKAGK
jgi:cytidylate kinase